MRPSREVLEIAEKLYWLGEIEPLVTPRRVLGEMLDENGGWRPDECLDDSALVYDGADGLVIITGCSHSGICNIVEQAKRATGREKIADVIGGFHLRSGSDEEMRPVPLVLRKGRAAENPRLPLHLLRSARRARREICE